MSSPWRPQVKGWIPALLSGKGRVDGPSALICSMCSFSSRASQKPSAQI